MFMHIHIHTYIQTYIYMHIPICLCICTAQVELPFLDTIAWISQKHFSSSTFSQRNTHNFAEKEKEKSTTDGDMYAGCA